MGAGRVRCVTHTSTHLHKAKSYFSSKPNSNVFLSRKISQMSSTENKIFLNSTFTLCLFLHFIIDLNQFCTCHLLARQ